METGGGGRPIVGCGRGGSVQATDKARDGLSAGRLNEDRRRKHGHEHIGPGLGHRRSCEAAPDNCVRSQTLMQSFLSQQQNWGQIGMGDASAIGGPFVDLMSKMAADPASVARAQVDLFNDSIGLWQKTAERMLLGRGSEPSPGKSDKRFKHADWTELRCSAS